MVTISLPVLMVGALINSFLIAITFYFLWPYFNINWADTPPHITFLWFSVLGWTANFVSVILFWSHTRNKNPAGR